MNIKSSYSSVSSPESKRIPPRFIDQETAPGAPQDSFAYSDNRPGPTGLDFLKSYALVGEMCLSVGVVAGGTVVGLTATNAFVALAGIATVGVGTAAAAAGNIIYREHRDSINWDKKSSNSNTSP